MISVKTDMVRRDGTIGENLDGLDKNRVLPYLSLKARIAHLSQVSFPGNQKFYKLKRAQDKTAFLALTKIYIQNFRIIVEYN